MSTDLDAMCNAAGRGTSHQKISRQYHGTHGRIREIPDMRRHLSPGVEESSPVEAVSRIGIEAARGSVEGVEPVTMCCCVKDRACGVEPYRGCRCASLSSPRPDIPDIPDIPASSRPLKRQGLPDGPVRVS